MLQITNSFLCALITITGVLLFGKIVLKESIKIKFSKLITFIFIASILYSYLYVYFDGPLKTFVILFINAFLFKEVYNISLSKSIILSILQIFIIIFPDLFELIFATKILGINNEVFYVFAGGILSNVIVSILFIILTLIIKKPLNKLINYKIDSNIQIIIYSILTLICIAMFFYVFISEYETQESAIRYVVIILLSLCILSSYIVQTVRNNILMNKYDKLLEFMTTYEEEIEKQRILRHETKNEFLNIKGQLTDDQNKNKIIEYIDEILGDKYKVKYEEYVKFHYLPANGIKGLCYFKVQEAQGKKINVSINISKQIKKSNIYDMSIKEQRDFARILGVYMDNAIEACLDCKKKQLGIEAYCKDKEFKMIITNTFNNEINNKIGKEKFSTKGINRGHGLLLVKKLIEKNQIFEIKTEINNNLYIQYITIKKVSN